MFVCISINSHSFAAVLYWQYIFWMKGPVCFKAMCCCDVCISTELWHDSIYAATWSKLVKGTGHGTYAWLGCVNSISNLMSQVVKVFSAFVLQLCVNFSLNHGKVISHLPSSLFSVSTSL